MNSEIELAGLEKFDKVSDIPFRIALPAFMTSELKTAFQIGFLLFFPLRQKTFSLMLL